LNRCRHAAPILRWTPGGDETGSGRPALSDAGAAGCSMKLTDLEREEFIALAQGTFDPELWTEDDLPLLRAAKKEFEKEQAREPGDVLRPPTERDNRDDEAGGFPAPHERNR